MHPILWETSYFTVHSYGFMISLAILTATFLSLREAPRYGYNPDHILEAVILLGVSGIIGSRVLYIILNLNYYLADWKLMFDLRIGGLSFYGAVFLSMVSLFFWCRWRKLSFLKIADFFAPYLMFGYAFGRIGCFLNGCCYGKITEFSIGLPAAFTDNLMRHPVQLYASAMALLFFVIIMRLKKYAFFDGFVLILLLFSYGILRFTTGFFRYDEVLFFGLSLAQLVSLLISLLTLLFFLYKKKKINQDEKALHEE